MKKKDNKVYSTQSTDSSNRGTYLQKTIGNQAVQKLIPQGHPTDIEIAIQPKLKVSKPGDIFEQEADKVADRLIKTPPLSYSKSDQKLFPASHNNEDLDRKKCPSNCETTKEDEEKDKAKITTTISRNASSKSSDFEEASDEITSQVRDLRADGSSLALDISTREFMESRFGHDFTEVKIHTGQAANRSANAVNAIAYTVGNDIIFGEGQYRPDTLEGRKLLAHELTHVVQQSNNINNTARSNTSLITSSPTETISRQKAAKSISAEELEKQFEQAILKSDWTYAIDRLASFSINDVPKLLERYVMTRSELELLKKAALTKFGSNESRILPAINTVIATKFHISKPS